MTNSDLQHPEAKCGWSFPLKQYHTVSKVKENQKIILKKLQRICISVSTRQVNRTGKNFKI